MKKTYYINIFAGPGIGKSTTAAGVFYKLKKRGFSCELVSEYIKEKLWEEHNDIVDDQIYIFAKQRHRLTALNGKVNFVITDAPLFMQIAYKTDDLSFTYTDLVIEEFNKLNNINFYINMPTNWQFKKEGRLGDEERTFKFHNEIHENLHDLRVPFTAVNRDVAVAKIVEKIINEQYSF